MVLAEKTVTPHRQHYETACEIVLTREGDGYTLRAWATSFGPGGDKEVDTYKLGRFATEAEALAALAEVA